MIRARSLHYPGQIHPASRKVVVTSRISKLLSSGALKSSEAAHKLKLLASTHFRPDDPEKAFGLRGLRLDASQKEQGEKSSSDNSIEDGEIKISCERFPLENQNLRWAAERVQLLCEEANVSNLRLSALPA